MEEKILIQGLCNRVKSPIFVQNGNGMLTNQRFIYSKHSFAKLAVMGVLANLTQGDYEFDIPISDIKSMTRGKQGISNNVIVIETKAGNIYKFAVAKYMEWEIAFKNALSSCNEISANENDSTIPIGKKFCTNCGTELAENVKFCGNCGTKV